MTNEHISRLRNVGLGLQAAKTAVASQVYVRYMKGNVQRQTKKLQNESAVGRVEQFNDSVTDQAWVEGPLEGKLQDVTEGYLLSSIMGLPVTTDNADTNPIVKDHTFNFTQANTPNYLTVADATPVASRRFPLCVVDDHQLDWKAGEWVTFKSNIKGASGTAVANTAAFIDENEFTGRHVTVKLASAVAGLGAAPALDSVSGNLKIERKSKPYFPTGSIDPTDMHTGSVIASGELVLRYNSTTYEDLWFNNTIQAMSIAFVNTDVTIGASARPGLVFTAPRTRLMTFDRSDDLDEIVEQTIGFNCELSAVDGYMLRAVLTNTQTSYVGT